MPLRGRSRQTSRMNQADECGFSHLYFLSRNQPEVLQRSACAKHIDAEALHRQIKKQRKAGIARAGLRFVLNLLRVMVRPLWAVMAGIKGMVIQVIAVLVMLGWRAYQWWERSKSGMGTGAKNPHLLWRSFALGAVWAQLVILAGALSTAWAKIVDMCMPVVVLVRLLVEWIGVQDQMIREVDLDMTDVGRSPLWWLVQSEAGIMVLSEIDNLADQISEEQLNNEYYYVSRQDVNAQLGVSNDGYGCEGMSILAILMMSRSGRELLLKHKKLTAKINKQGLLSCIKSRRGGAFRGASVLWMLSSQIIRRELTGLVNIDEGIKILAQIDDLERKISIVELMQSPEIRRFNDFPPFVLWVAMDEGKKLLARNPGLCQQITQACLRMEGVGGLTVLQLLCMHDAGIEVLLNIGDIENKISQDDLNAAIRSGGFAGYSVLLLLSANEKGRELLRRVPGLCQKIKSQALFRQVQGEEYAGTSAFWHLLRNDIGLIKKPWLSEVTESILMQRPHSETGGDSVIWMLSSTAAGVELMNENENIINALSKRLLAQTAKDDKNRGVSVLSHLASTNMGVRILARVTGIERKITAEMLAQRVAVNGRTEETPIAWLCKTEQGCELLEKLTGKITAKMLNGSPVRDACTGDAPIIHLCMRKKGRDVLQKIAEKITFEGLCLLRKRADSRGISVLEILLLTPNGRCVLEACCGVLAQLTPEILDRKNSLGQTALLIFAKTPKGRSVLARIPGIEDKITAEGLNTIVLTNRGHLRECVLWHLCLDDVWRRLFKSSRKLRANINGIKLQLGLRKIESEMTDMSSDDRASAVSDINEILQKMEEDIQTQPRIGGEPLPQSLSYRGMG